MKTHTHPATPSSSSSSSSPRFSSLLSGLTAVPPRDAIFSLLTSLSLLTSHASSPHSPAFKSSLRAFYSTLLTVSLSCRVPSLSVSILRKIELNTRKYPVERCRGKSGKYTDYTDTTGVTSCVSTQSLSPLSPAVDDDVKGGEDSASSEPTVDDLTSVVDGWVSERDWSKFHTPRNILLALAGEVGELCEIFQWMGDGGEEGEGWWREKGEAVEMEVADIAIYGLRLASLVGGKVY